MIVSCTKKVLDKLKRFKPIENTKEKIGPYNCYVDLINLERRNDRRLSIGLGIFSISISKATSKAKTIFSLT